MVVVVVLMAVSFVIPVSMLFPDDEVGCPSAILMEPEYRQNLYMKMQNELRPCVSLHKVMTLVLRWKP